MSLSLGKMRSTVKQCMFRLPNIKDPGDPGNERGRKEWISLPFIFIAHTNGVYNLENKNKHNT